MVDFRVTGFGRDALAALAAEIRSCKSEDVLAPVTVIVPSHRLEVVIRRDLAEFHGGFAGIHFTTLNDLATKLLGDTLSSQSRTMANGVVRVAAIRQVLQKEPGIFAGVVDHASTEQALAASYEELNDLSESDLLVLESYDGRCAEVVRILRATRKLLADQFYDQQYLYNLAADRYSASDPVVTYLPTESGSASVSFMRAIGRHASRFVIIAAIAGHDGADRDTKRLLKQMGFSGELPQIESVTGSAVISTSDPDDEVRSAVRVAIRAIADGANAHRVAILYSSTRPYARLVAEHLAQSDIAYNGPGIRTLAESIPGRLLSALIRISDHDLRRDDVIALFGSAPLHDSQGSPMPTSDWDRLTRDAGVVGGDDWTVRLDHHREQLGADLARPGLSDSRARRTRRDIALCEQLQNTVADLRSTISSISTPSWSNYTALYRSLIEQLLNPDALDDQDQSDCEQVITRLSRLDELDSIESNVSPSLFRRTVEIELSVGQGNEGSTGEGICVGPLSEAIGRVFDHVIVVGMVEGLLPGRAAEDSLIGDAQRQSLKGQIRLARHKPDRQHRELLAALASAPRLSKPQPTTSVDAAARAVANGNRTLMYPRGDLRSSTDRVASRWLLDSTEVLEGKRIKSDDLSTLKYSWLTCVPSFGSAIRSTEFAASHQEFRLKQLSDALGQGEQLSDLSGDDGVLHAAVELQSARWSSRFTRFDGNLAGESIPHVGVDYAVSPTQLESWVHCPFGYFMHRFLRVDPLDTPENVFSISALDRGSLIHEVLDKLIDEAITADTIPAPDEPWPESTFDRLAELFWAESARYASEGKLGKPLLWKRESLRVLHSLEAFLLLDDQVRSHRRSRPISTEASFGLDDVPELVHTLPDGTQIRFRGSADRIDISDDGEILITDYKSGSSTSFSKLSEANPVSAGEKLQLPVYGLAARQLLGLPDAPARAEYRFIADQVPLGYVLTEEILEIFGLTVQTILEGISGGMFVQIPVQSKFGSDYNPCVYCNPDDLGIGRIESSWRRKMFDPSIETYHALGEITS